LAGCRIKKQGWGSVTRAEVEQIQQRSGLFIEGLIAEATQLPVVLNEAQDG
jgi:hypothetical protein